MKSLSPPAMPDNRREAFRLNRLAYLRISRTNAEETEGPKEVEAAAPLSVQTAALQALHAIHLQDRELTRVLDRDAAEAGPNDQALGMLNRKLDQVIAILADQIAAQAGQQIVEIGLSEGGIAFQSPEPVCRNTQIRVHLIILPDYLPLDIGAEILGCERRGRQYHIRARFTDMTVEDRNLLVRSSLREQRDRMRNSA